MSDKPRGWSDGWGSVNRPEERMVDEAPKPQFSGLYNAEGQPLYKHPNPVGFLHNYDRKTK